ncbi:gp58-like family protein, partial [Weissella minor]|uniref:gp58-like family protein n=1 Tax=Weissella minor TaxID=1620 RepID=UPI001F27A2CD
MFNENFGLGIKDNVGSIISGINGDTSGLAITGKKVAINGDTTVNGDFWTKNVNAVKVNASNITAGTIDAKKVNLVNLTANLITTGTLQGININVNKTLEIVTGGVIKWNTDSTIRGYSDRDYYWMHGKMP